MRKDFISGLFVDRDVLAVVQDGDAGVGGRAGAERIGIGLSTTLKL